MFYQQSRDIFRDTVKQLAPIGATEAQAIANILVEDVFGLDQNEIILNKEIDPSEHQIEQLKDYTTQILQGKPVQYVVGYAYFYGHKFIVNRSTLIPRQETEQLIELTLKEIQEKEQPKVLDIGTGSGCIAISVALGCEKSMVSGMDVSEEALQAARMNNMLLKAGVRFFMGDIFSRQSSRQYDLIVSNPPYVLESERELMERNVLEHEPPLALFVPDDEPLLYYKAIINKTNKLLVSGGAILFEINEKMGTSMAELIEKNGFTGVQIVKDIYGKDRFVKGLKT